MAMTFFGTEPDLLQIWRWLFEVPAMRILEDYSVPDKPNRWFDTWESVVDFWESGSRGLAAWPESVGAKPRFETIIFEPNTQRKLGATGRTALHTPAMIKIGRNNDQKGCLASASIGYWTEKGARQRSIFPEEFIDDVDWALFRSITGRVQRQITKAAPAKLRAYAIMPDAYAKLAAGELKLWNWGEACELTSPLVTRT